MATPRDGALAVFKNSTVHFWANPGDTLFSTVTMGATHVYKNGQWLPIFSTDDKIDRWSVVQNSGPLTEFVLDPDGPWISAVDHFKAMDALRRELSKP